MHGKSNRFCCCCCWLYNGNRQSSCFRLNAMIATVILYVCNAQSFGCHRAWRLQLLLTECFFDTLSSTQKVRCFKVTLLRVICEMDIVATAITLLLYLVDFFFLLFFLYCCLMFNSQSWKCEHNLVLSQRNSHVYAPRMALIQRETNHLTMWKRLKLEKVVN